MTLTPEEEAAIEIEPTIDDQIASELAYLPSDTPSFDDLSGPTIDMEDPVFLETLAGADDLIDPSFEGSSTPLSPAEEASIELEPTAVTQKASTSFRGFGPDRGQGAMRARGDSRFADEADRLAQQRDADLAELDRGYGRLETETGEHADIEAEFQRENAKLLRQKQQWLEKSAELDKVAHAQAKAESQQYLDAYQKQMAAVRQMTVTSPLQQLDAWSNGALSLGMFAQGFLAAQGIQIDVSGQIDRWVDQSIEEQKRRIGQAEAGAQDQLDLWRIAQETSRNDLEARQRYRGMVLEGLEVGVEVNAARFAAPLARSAADVARAKIAIEKANVAIGIRQNHEKERLDYFRAIGEDQHRRVIERIQSMQAALEERRLRLQENEASKTSQLLKIADPGATERDESGNIVGVRNGWAVNPNAPASVQTAAAKFAAEEGGAYAKFLTQLAKLRKLRVPAQDEYKERFGTKWSKMYSEDYRAYKRQKDLIGEQLTQYLTGAAAPEAQMKRIQGVLADDSVFQKGGNAAGLDDLEQWSRDNFISQANEHPGLVPLPESERDVRPYVNMSNDTQSGYNARHNKNLPTTNLIATVEGAAAGGEDRTTEAAQPSSLGGLSTAFKMFAGKNKLRLSAGRVPEFVGSLEDIALAAVDPAAIVAKYRSTEKPEDVQRDAVTRLEYLSTDQTIPSGRRGYAAHLYEQLKKDPQGLLEDLTVGDLTFR